MSELVERVARAMQNEVAKGRFSLPTHQARQLAREAIAAMREPTSAMEGSGAPALLTHFRSDPAAAARAAGDAWRGMIDEALS